MTVYPAAFFNTSFHVNNLIVQNHPRIKRRVFKALKDIIYAAAGINMSEKKIPLLEGRLHKRLRALGVTSFDDYLIFLDNGRNQEEMVTLLDCVSTNETTFFREYHQYLYLEQNVFPRIKADVKAGRRGKTIKVWSTACSTGDELYGQRLL